MIFLLNHIFFPHLIRNWEISLSITTCKHHTETPPHLRAYKGLTTKVKFWVGGTFSHRQTLPHLMGKEIEKSVRNLHLYYILYTGFYIGFFNHFIQNCTFQFSVAQVWLHQDLLESRKSFLKTATCPARVSGQHPLKSLVKCVPSHIFHIPSVYSSSKQ